MSSAANSRWLKFKGRQCLNWGKSCLRLYQFVLGLKLRGSVLTGGNLVKYAIISCELGLE